LAWTRHIELLLRVIRRIDGWPIEDKNPPKKQRHTARRVRQRLAFEHDATLSEVTVSRYGARRRVELGLDHREVSIPRRTWPARRRRSTSASSTPRSPAS
jgi:hypothetical protein